MNRYSIIFNIYTLNAYNTDSPSSPIYPLSSPFCAIVFIATDSIIINKLDIVVPRHSFKEKIFRIIARDSKQNIGGYFYSIKDSNIFFFLKLDLIFHCIYIPRTNNRRDSRIYRDSSV